jgi:methylmalonyl-CoA/ethylmalonyl-CoA epimerase
MSFHEEGGYEMIKKIDHIGIAVKNLGDALRLYKKVYGLEPIKTETLDDINVKIAFIPLGEVLIELLEPTAPGAGRIGKFIEEKGEGFHHIAFRVEDIDHAMEKLKEIRVPLRDQKPRDGGDESRIAFIESAFTQNVLTELVERKREVKRD